MHKPILLIPPKRCTACGKYKSRGEFHKRRASKDGLRPTCKLCHASSVGDYYRSNKSKVQQNYRKWKQTNEEVLHEYGKNYYRLNKSKIVKRTSEYRRQRLRVDNLYRATKAFRNLTTQAFHRSGYKKRSKCNTLLGCDFATAKQHIESQFLPGMSWANHGEWHIDHKIPLSSAKTIEGREKLCHYTNLQPLWANDNMRKSNKVAT